VQSSKTQEEFDPRRPVASAAAVLRGIFFAPRRFFLNFSAEGPLREPTLFVLLISAVSGVLSVALNLVLGVIFGTGANIGGVVVLNLAFVVLSPVFVGVAAGAYLLSVLTFVGPGGRYREVYRMLAYAYGAMILFPFPVLNAIAFTYAALILMWFAIRGAYRTSFLSGLITALVGFLPVALAFIYLVVTANSLIS
jgi:hypothetical protein